jgi:hypothetical protein
MPQPMPNGVFRTGTFAGVPTSDAFAAAAIQENPVIIHLAPVAWPPNLAPKTAAFGNFSPGEKITGPAPSGVIDVLIILYTDPETSALLDVFTGKSGWTETTQKTWYPYAHNFDQFKNSIQGLNDNDSLRAGIFGHLASLTVGETRVALYKTELHPKTNGPSLPFIPVIAQLIGELQPKLVISTGTAGGIGSSVNCGDVIITNAARLHCQQTYPLFPNLNALSKNSTQLKNTVAVNNTYVKQAAADFTKLSMPGLSQCYNEIKGRPGYSFLRANAQAPAIYLAGVNPVPGPEPMDIVSADYLTVDDNHDSEGLQALGIMNDTDDAFAFYAIRTLPAGKQPKWLSVRNASEPQVNVPPFPAGTSPTQVIDKLKGLAGGIYGVYQYCTTINSAFACWGIVAGM